MRTLTIDTKGFLFSVKLLVVFAVVAGAWYTLNSVHTLVMGDTSKDGSALSALVSYATEQKEASAEEESETTMRAIETAVPEKMVRTHKGRYAWIDAKEMMVTLFRDGMVIRTAPILHIPPQDSPDALTAGSYSVGSIEKVLSSSVTMTRFPHHVRFGDRFSIHGIPTTAQGDALPESLPGGSIVLSTEDAERVASYLEPGLMVYVEAPLPHARPSNRRLSVRNGEVPATTAIAFALVDMETGQTYLAKNEEEQYPIASITKLVTAAVASEVIGHGTTVVAPSGEHYTLGDLFYPLLLRSDNGVAHRIAQHIGTGAFLAHMNAYMQAHGMVSSSFGDSSGLSPKNLSTVQDLTVLARHLMHHKSYLLAMTSEAQVTLTAASGATWHVTNQNRLAHDPHFRGGKLGFTDEAGQTSLAIFNVPLGDTVHPVAVVVLGSKDWRQDTRTLLKWLVDSVY
jgi:hypothetical protein